MSDNISAAFPGWETDGVLGSGAFGTVYLAHTLVDEKMVYAAVKVIRTPPGSEAVANAESLGIGRDLLRTYFGKFKNELNWELTMFKTISSQHLANIDTVAMEDLPDAGWTGYIRSAVYTPLDVYLESSPSAMEDAVRLGVEISAALVDLGDYGMVHGEVKPENILVSDNGSFLLADYGIRRCLEKAGTGLFGLDSNPYEAPEVGEDRRYSPLTDIYSLGMVICYAANGMTLPVDLNPDNIQGIDPKLSEIIKKATAKNPEERYATARELYEELSKHALYVKRRPQRRAVAAAAAFDLVKKNGGSINSPPRKIETPIPGGDKSGGGQKAGNSGKEEHVKSSNKSLVFTIIAVAVLALIILLLLNRCSAGGDDSGSDEAQQETGASTEETVTDTTVPIETVEIIEEEDEDVGSTSDENADTASGEILTNEDEGEETASDSVSLTSDESTPATDEGESSTSGSSSSTSSSSGSTGSGSSSGSTVTTATSSKYILPNSDTVLITREDLQGMSRADSYTAINEIYARHGKIFTDASIQSYFESQSWYTPVTTSSEAIVAELNQTEKANVITIVAYQVEMGYRETDEDQTGEGSSEESSGVASESSDSATDKATSETGESTTTDDYILPTDTRLITREELEGFTREESYMAINEIYARHGKIFTDSSIQAYFEAKSWYTPVTSDSTAITPLFTEIERTNLHVLTAYQREMGYRE